MAKVLKFRAGLSWTLTGNSAITASTDNNYPFVIEITDIPDTVPASDVLVLLCNTAVWMVSSIAYQVLKDYAYSGKVIKQDASLQSAQLTLAA